MRSELERKYVRNVYALLTVRLLIQPLFGTFVGNTTVLRLLELVVMVAALYNALRCIREFKPFAYGRWCMVLIGVLAATSLLTVLRGNFAGGLKQLIFTINGETKVLAYLLPFIILPLPNVKYFRTLLDVLFYACLAAIPLWAINMAGAGLVRESYHGESVGAYFPFAAAFLLGFIRRFPARRRIAVIAVFVVYLLLMVLNARRNVILSLALFFLFAFVVYVIPVVKNSPKGFAGIIAGLVAVILLVAANFGTLSKGVLSNLLARGMEDTRSQVEILFAADLAASPLSDTMIGRGMDGTYFQITEDEETFETSTDRDVIETGYMYFILKGGIFYALVIILLTISAMVSAFRCRGSLPMLFIGFVMIIYLVDMYTTNPVCVYSLRSMIFWMSVSLALQYRKLK